MVKKEKKNNSEELKIENIIEKVERDDSQLDALLNDEDINQTINEEISNNESFSDGAFSPDSAKLLLNGVHNGFDLLFKTECFKLNEKELDMLKGSLSEVLNQVLPELIKNNPALFAFGVTYFAVMVPKFNDFSKERKAKKIQKQLIEDKSQETKEDENPDE